MEVTYKLVKNDDIDYIVALDKLMRIEEPEFYNTFNEEEYRKNWNKYPIQENTTGDIILCLNGDDVVGRVDLMYERSYMDFSIVGYIDWIYIRLMYRGKGYGKQLLLKAQEQFKEKNCEKYYLFIAENDQAIKFYDSTDLDITTINTGVKNLK